MVSRTELTIGFLAAAPPVALFVITLGVGMTRALIVKTVKPGGQRERPPADFTETGPYNAEIQ